MPIKVTDAVTKPEWVRDLGAVLHDAGLEDEPKWDEAAKRLEVSLTRICYEKPHKKKVLFIIPACGYQSTLCKLVVEQVEKVTEKKQRGRYLLAVMEYMRLTRKGELEVGTGIGRYRLTLAPGAFVEAEDTGPTDETQLMLEPGGSGPMPPWMKRILEADIV